MVLPQGFQQGFTGISIEDAPGQQQLGGVNTVFKTKFGDNAERQTKIICYFASTFPCPQFSNFKVMRPIVRAIQIATRPK